MTATAQSNIIPFAFEDHLVRVVKPNGEPWFVGKDVCSVLSIKDHTQALDRLDEDERGGYIVPTPQGDQTAICVSEPGVFRLIFTSRKPEAERFKRWLAHEVLPMLRKSGSYTVPGREGEAAATETGTVAGEPVAVIAQKLSMVRESRLIHGVDRARLLWDNLGLPQVPGGDDQAKADALLCLKAVLATPLTEDRQDLHFTVMHAILCSLDDSSLWDERLRKLGIRVYPEKDGFVVGNHFGYTPGVGTIWNGQRAYRMLLHIPGSRRAGPTKFDMASTHRGVFIPAAALDTLDAPIAH